MMPFTPRLTVAAPLRCATIRLLSFLLLLTLFAIPRAAQAQAQERSAVVRGVVRAQSGRPLAGAIVRVEQLAAADTSDSGGAFTLDVPARRALDVRVSREGFADARIDVSALAPGATRALAVTLAPLVRLDVQTIVADARRPLLNTLDAATGGRLEREELVALPTDARDPIALAYTVPGVSQGTGFFGDAPRLTINGANTLYTQYTLDGLDNNEGFLGGPRVEVPLSALASLGVLANTYGADAGRSSNGIVDMRSLAGSDGWRGELFAYNRPGRPLDARAKVIPSGVDPDAFNEAQDGFRRLQVGGAIGGPLKARTTYGFIAAEYGNENEDRIASTASAAFVGRELRQTGKGLLRVDHGWTPGQTTTVRIAASAINREGRGSGIVAPEADITTRRIGSLAAVTHRSAARDASWSNTASLQTGTFRWDFPPAASDFSRPQVTIVRPVPGNPLQTEPVAIVGSSNFVFDEREFQLQLRDQFEIVLGPRHTLTAGVDVARSSFTLLGGNTNPQGSYTVLDEGNIQPRAGGFYTFDDVPADARVLRYVIDANPKRVALSQLLAAGWIEDRWRPTASLTVLAGVRWDYDDLTSRGESTPDLDNVQPRVSFNWYATPTTVVRGGAGLYAGKFPYAVYSDAVQFGPDGNAVVTLDGAEAPAYLQGPRGDALLARRDSFPPREIRRLFALGLEQPMSRQASAGIQRTLGDRAAIAFDGVVVDTRNLPRSWDLNASTRGIREGDDGSVGVAAGDAFRPVQPAVGSFRRLTTTESGGRSLYAGLYTQLTVRPAERTTIEAKWVWSRNRTDTEDINFNATQGNDFDAEWSDAINDRRHHLTLRGVWGGPGGVTLSGVADYQTGTPINRTAGFCGATFCDLDGSGDTFGNGFLGNQDRYFGVGRNAERLPSSVQLAASAAYALPIANGALDLRLDVFNLLNSTIVSGFANGIPGGGPRTQFGRPGDPTVWTAAAPPRQLQLSATYRFGPR